jgi:hypothetical protein
VRSVAVHSYLDLCLLRSSGRLCSSRRVLAQPDDEFVRC